MISDRSFSKQRSGPHSKRSFPIKTSDFDFNLPDHLIAQVPAPNRENSRLLAIDRQTRSVRHLQFSDLPGLLQPGDVMIRNDSRVIPGRIRGTKAGSGGRFEILLCTENAVNDWWVLLRPGKRVHPGTRLLLNDRSSTPCGIEALVQEKNAEGHVRLQFVGCNNLLEHLQEIGELPLPPYIRRDSTGPRPEDESRYQTVYAGRPGSLAAPTAGLHYTPELLEAIRNRGVEIHNITLHIGLGTFAPVKTDEVEDHIMHSERFEIPEPTARAVREAMTSGRRVVAVGTTATRALESAAAARQGRVEAMSASTSIFIRPPTDFRVIGALQTNFHLPQSTLLMLVAAFASPGRTDGRDWILSVYHQAIERDYRFFSYGDSMFIS